MLVERKWPKNNNNNNNTKKQVNKIFWSFFSKKNISGCGSASQPAAGWLSSIPTVSRADGRVYGGLQVWKTHALGRNKECCLHQNGPRTEGMECLSLKPKRWEQVPSCIRVGVSCAYLRVCERKRVVVLSCRCCSFFRLSGLGGQSGTNTGGELLNCVCVRARV